MIGGKFTAEEEAHIAVVLELVRDPSVRTYAVKSEWEGREVTLIAASDDVESAPLFIVVTDDMDIPDPLDSIDSQMGGEATDGSPPGQ